MTVSQNRTIREYLESFRGGSVYHPALVDNKGELVGNNGDRLMVMGTDLLYADMGLHRVDDAAHADLVVLGASGGMLDSFTHIPRLFKRLSTGYPATPMCVLPSTFYYKSRAFKEDIGSRSAELAIFCRERYSYEHLLSQHSLPPCCSVHLDHDLAFELEAGEYVRRAAQMTPEHVLIVERVDVEHVSQNLNSSSTSMRLRKQLGRHAPTSLKRLLYPAVRFLRSKRRTPFREQCEQLLALHHREFLELPRLVADVSNVNTCTFDQFTEAVGRAAVIFTTRLHVGILGAIMGRPTFIFEGPYHKIRGIYEHSLAHRSCVLFVPLRCESAT